MPTYARIQDGIVAELYTPLQGVSIATCFAPGLVWIDVTSQPNVAPGWTYDGSTFAAPVTPPLTPQQTLAAKIALGIALTCTSDSSLNATYALDGTTMDQIGSVARDQSSGLGLPGGASTFDYPDKTSTPHTFTGQQLVDLYKAQRNLLFVLNTQAGIMAHGGTPSWPTQAATIS